MLVVYPDGHSPSIRITWAEKLRPHSSVTWMHRQASHLLILRSITGLTISPPAIFSLIRHSQSVSLNSLSIDQTGIYSSVDIATTGLRNELSWKTYMSVSKNSVNVWYQLLCLLHSCLISPTLKPINNKLNCIACVITVILAFSWGACNYGPLLHNSTSLPPQLYSKWSFSEQGFQHNNL